MISMMEEESDVEQMQTQNLPVRGLSEARWSVRVEIAASCKPICMHCRAAAAKKKINFDRIRLMAGSQLHRDQPHRTAVGSSHSLTLPRIEAC